jgi:hypothetical protein
MIISLRIWPLVLGLARHDHFLIDRTRSYHRNYGPDTTRHLQQGPRSDGHGAFRGATAALRAFAIKLGIWRACGWSAGLWRVAGNVHLCGHRFSPVRDPQRFPVCPRCKELAGMLGIGG